MKQRIQTRWKPQGAITILDKDRLGIAYFYTRKGQPALVAYRGKALKPALHITTATTAMLEDRAKRWFDELRENARQSKLCRERMDQDEMSRNSVIRRIKAGLAARGFRYSVTGGRGTAWGWITIDLLPADLKTLSREEQTEAYARLNEALGIVRRGPFRGSSISVAASHDYYREYIDRAEGRKPAKLGTPYWD